MAKVFNVTGPCIPNKHYMADMTGRIRQIRGMVDAGAYFTGYMLSFNFNQKKQIAVKEIQVGNKRLIEAVV